MQRKRCIIKLEETGITMHSWCGGGIRYQGGGVHDQLEYIQSKRDWCFENAYETYKWLADRDDVIVKKIGGNKYRLDVKAVRFPHVFKLHLPVDTAVSEHAYHVRAYE